MSADIVERAKKHAKPGRTIPDSELGPYVRDAALLLLEAADEITRLREQRDAWRAAAEDYAVKINAAVEALEKIRDGWATDAKKITREVLAHIRGETP